MSEVEVESQSPTQESTTIIVAEKPLEAEKPENDKGSTVVPVAVKASSGEVVGVGSDSGGSAIWEGPPEVQRRVKALKKIQLDVARTESDFFREMHELEVKYSKKYTGFYEKRREIVLGKYEPTDEECKFNCGGDGAEEESQEKNDADGGATGGSGAGATQEDSKLADSLKNLKIKDEPPVSGIPEFWLTAFQNVEILGEMIEDHDLPILKHLTDVKVEITSKPMGFKLLFHFSPNEYFKDSFLSKTYEMKCEVDTEDPFSFEGPEIVKCSGCEISWNEGKNVTIRTVRKRQKHKQTGNIRMVEKVQEVPSFFSFFTPPKPAEGEEEFDEDAQLQLTTHFEVGQYIRERIIPRAVLYYTGEALEDDDDSDDYDEDTEETDAEHDNSQSTNPDNNNNAEEENPDNSTL